MNLRAALSAGLCLLRGAKLSSGGDPKNDSFGAMQSDACWVVMAGEPPYVITMASTQWQDTWGYPLAEALGRSTSDPRRW